MLRQLKWLKRYGFQEKKVKRLVRAKLIDIQVQKVAFTGQLSGYTAVVIAAGAI